MKSDRLREKIVAEVLPLVQTPGQYLGGELNAVVKDHAHVRGTLCLAFPDAYTIGMSHHGLQLLYHLLNARDDWACERAFTPLPDMEAKLREHGLPLFSLETFTPLAQFDVLGFSLQYELCSTNVLTMLDLAGIPLEAERRTEKHPLIIAGGPGAAVPEPMAHYIDLFVVGDGEEALPAVCDAWLDCRKGSDRRDALAAVASRLPFVYVPQLERKDPVKRAVVRDLDAVPLPTRPVVPYVECVQDRITLEIMRGCPGRCRFCQSRPLKHPLRARRVETIVAAAEEAYRNTGYNEIGLLSLSTSDYPDFDELMRRLDEVSLPLGVSISVPSLRVNEQWRTVAEKLSTARHSGLTLAPEAARDELRQAIGKHLTNDDLMAGCRRAFECGFSRVKLYFMCGLPGEEPEDLDAIIDLSVEIAQLGREVRGRWPVVVTNVSNFVPKPHTPFEREPMQTGDYFRSAHRRLRERRRPRAVQLKYHDVETSLLEGVIARGDRAVGRAILRAWQAGARLDAWSDHFEPGRWWEALAAEGVPVDDILHRTRSPDEPLPWDHIQCRGV